MPRRYKKYHSRKGAEVYGRLNKDAVRSASNLPQGAYRRSDHSDIPSHGIVTTLDPGEETARNSVIERVRTGKITGAEAQEVIRKSRCLAPAYNKGAYQYIGTNVAAEDAGRKK